jgi:hypothetical protein
MADITMCHGALLTDDKATLCKDCYRFNAKPNEYRQAYFIQVPMLVDGSCDEFWQDKKAIQLEDFTLPPINLPSIGKVK